MRLAIVLLLVTGALAAQTATLTPTGPASIAQGQTATLTFTLSGSTGQNLSAIEWTLAPPSGLTLGAPTAGTASTAANKAVLCNPSTGLCVAVPGDAGSPPVVGVGPYSDGVVATISATFSGPTGNLSLPLTALLGSSTTATALTVSAGASLTIAITPSHCDFTGDGKVDYTDVVGLANAVIGNSTCPASFTAGCSLKNIEAVAIAAGTGVCSL